MKHRGQNDNFIMPHAAYIFDKQDYISTITDWYKIFDIRNIDFSCIFCVPRFSKAFNSWLFSNDQRHGGFSWDTDR